MVLYAAIFAYFGGFIDHFLILAIVLLDTYIRSSSHVILKTICIGHVDLGTGYYAFLQQTRSVNQMLL